MGVKGTASWLVLWLAVVCTGVSGSAYGENHVQAELVVDVQAFEAGKPFRAGVLFTIEPKAHIYWRHPGSSGLATGIEWTLPEGFAVGDLQWPNPERFEIVEIDDISYGYTREVLLFAEVSVPSGPSLQGPLNIEVEPYWLVCLEDGQCIPEGARLRMRLPAGRAMASASAASFDQYGARLPAPLSEVSSVSLDEKEVTVGRLRFMAREPWRFAAASEGIVPRFFPDEGPAWNVVEPEGGGEDTRLSFTFERLRNGKATVQAVNGVATLPLRHAESGAKNVVYLRVER